MITAVKAVQPEGILPVEVRTSWIYTGAALVLLIATVKFALHLYAARFYGYFIDELYFMACSEHLAWGYVDQPPLIALIVKVARVLFGDSLQAIRLFAGLAGAVTILLTGRITRELGGGRFAQGLAALAVLLSGVNLFTNHYISMNAFEQLFWMGCALIVIRIIKTGNQKLWLWVGVLAGLGLNNKYSMGFFGAGIVIGLLLTSQRGVFLKPWIWLGGAIAAVMILPNLIWNVQHHFPFFELMANIRRSGRNIPLTPLQFLGQQVLNELPANLPIWVAGLWYLFFARNGKQFRVLGWTFLTVLAILFLPNSRPYYIAPAYPMLMAAGAVAWEAWLSRPRLQWLKPAYVAFLILFGAMSMPFSLPILPVETYIRYSKALHFGPPKIETFELGPLPQIYAAMFGAEEMTQVVAQAYNALPPEERGKTAIFAFNYGDAGAIDLFGRKYGLPKAISGHQSYFLWGLRDYTLESVIAIGGKREWLEPFFVSVEEVGSVYHPYSMPYEHRKLYHCRGLKRPMEQVWSKLKYWD